MRESFDKLPREEQDAILNEIRTMLNWRGWDRRPGMRISHANQGVTNIEKIFERNGIEFEEFT